MPRQRSPNSIRAEEIYIGSGGEIELIEIAKRLDVSDGTVRSWKNRYKWDDKLNGNNNATLRKKKRTKRNVAKKESEKSIVEKAIEESDIEEAGLTEKQRLFCLYHVKYWNAGKAARKAGYECSYPNGFYEIGCQLLKKTQVKKQIDKLKRNIRECVFLEAMAVLQKYIDIAFADITDYVAFGQEEVPVMTMYGPLEIENPETGEKETVTKMVNMVKFKDSAEVDGTILTEVSKGKDGAKIKLADKMKALDKLSEYCDLFPDKFKRKIEEGKLALAKAKAGEDEKAIQDDGFIEALTGRASEVWEDEEG